MKNGVKAGIEAVNIASKLAQVSDYWSPKIVATLNNHEVKVAMLKGEFTWHHHDDAEELFWVIKGKLVIHFIGHDVLLLPGELFVVPKKTEHKPEALPEAEIVLIEPAGTLNTGNVVNEKTVKEPGRI